MTPIPYPADTRAKGWRFELDYEQIRQSDTWALAKPVARPWLLLLWLMAWEQTPCGSISADDAVVAAKLDMPPELWEEHKGILLRGWWVAEDGRRYHNTLVERCIEMMGRRRKESDRKALARSRKVDGPPPPSNGSPVDVPRDKPGTDAGLHPESDTGTGTGSNTALPHVNAHRVRAGEDEQNENPGSHRGVTRDNPGTAEVITFAPSKAGEIGMALKRAGVDPQTLNLSDPRLAALIAQGAAPEEFAGLAKEAMAKGIAQPWAWVLAVLPKRRAEAAALVLAPAATPPDPGAAVVEATTGYLEQQRKHREAADVETTPEARAALRARLAEARAAITNPTRRTSQ